MCVCVMRVMRVCVCQIRVCVMISGYAQVGLMADTRRLFTAMPEKNCFSWSAIVSGYVACGDLDSAWSVFMQS